MERTPCSYVSYGKVAEEERAGTGLMDYIAIVLLVMCLPLGKILPATIAWENGPLEILQVLILLAGAGLACFFAKGNLRSMWSGVGGVFFLMISAPLAIAASCALKTFYPGLFGKSSGQNPLKQVLLFLPSGLKTKTPPLKALCSTKALWRGWGIFMLMNRFFGRVLFLRPRLHPYPSPA